MPLTDAPARPAGSGAAPPPALIVALVGAVVAGAFAVWQPLVGLALALVVVIAVMLRDIPMRRLAPVVVIVTALAAVAGPNLAPPGVPGLFLFRILIVLLGLGALAYLLMDGRLTLPAGMALPAGTLGVWLVWAVVSIGWAEDTAAAVRWSSFMAMMIALALAIALLCRSRRRAQILLWCLAGAFGLACLVAMGEAATGLHLPSFRAGTENRGGLIGVGSLFGNQNNFAAFLSISLPYFAVLPIVFRDVRLKAVGFAGGALALMFILLAGSKSGLLSAGFVVIGLLVLVGTDRRSRGRLLVAGAIAVMAVVLVVPILQGAGPVKLDERTTTKLSFNVLRSQIDSDSGSGGVRSALLSDGLNIIDETNGLGVGAGNAETQVRALVNSPAVANLHNWWLEVLVNLGVVGLGLYLFFFVTLLRGQARASRRTRDPFVRYMSLAGALSLIGWIIGSVGPSTAIHFTPMWIMFGLGMGALVLARQEKPPSAS